MTSQLDIRPTVAAAPRPSPASAHEAPVLQTRAARDYLDWRTPPEPFPVERAPDREPPLDDDQRQPAASARVSEQQLPFGHLAPSPIRRPSVCFERLTSATRTNDESLELVGFARRFAIAVVETATGRRSASQLCNFTSPGVQAGMVRDAGRIRRLGTAARPATLHSLRLTEPADGVIEAAAVVRVDTRYRAIAFRLEGTESRWRCVRLQIG